MAQLWFEPLAQQRLEFAECTKERMRESVRVFVFRSVGGRLAVGPLVGPLAVGPLVELVVVGPLVGPLVVGPLVELVVVGPLVGPLVVGPLVELVVVGPLVELVVVGPRGLGRLPLHRLL